MASTANSTRTTEIHGPVTRALAAMRTEPEPPRRALLMTAGAALVGTIIGIPKVRADIDLTGAAEAWIEDAKTLGMWLFTGPDGEVWRGMPVSDNGVRREARERHWIRLGERPALRRAVRIAVERGAR